MLTCFNVQKTHYFLNTVHYCSPSMPRLSQTHCFQQSPSFAVCHYTNLCPHLSQNTLTHTHTNTHDRLLYTAPKTIEIQRQFTPILMNGRKCNAQYGRIVPPSKWKSQSLIDKVIASLQRLLEASVPIETWGWNSRSTCTVISALELRMHIGWSSLKNTLFKCYLSIRNNIHGAVHIRFYCWFEIYNLIASSASRFWDFRIPPFI